MFFQPQYLQDVRGHSAVAQRPADPADHGADDLHLALLGAPDRPLRRPPADDRRHGLRHRSASLRPHPGRRRQLLRGCCWSATCCSGSRSASSTRRCRPRRWRRCRARRSGSPPACWRWTGCWPAPSRWPPPAPSSTPCSATATRFAAAIAGSTWVLGRALRGRRRAHLGLRPRPDRRADPRWPAIRSPASSSTTGITAASTSEPISRLDNIAQ